MQFFKYWKFSVWLSVLDKLRREHRVRGWWSLHKGSVGQLYHIIGTMGVIEMASHIGMVSLPPSESHMTLGRCGYPRELKYTASLEKIVRVPTIVF